MSKNQAQATQEDFNEEVAPKAKKVKAPKLDAEGNPIVKAPKLDAEGNPIVKAPAVKIDHTAIICLVKNEDGSFKANPKRANTNAFAMFELYKDGQTVKDFIEAGGSTEWVRWDISKGHITLA
jgi:hypothetical protein